MADQPDKTKQTTPAAGPGAPSALASWLDWPSLTDLKRDLDALFDDVAREGTRLPSAVRAMGERFPGPFALRPSVDMVEGQSAYRITAELPGMEIGDVAVVLSGDRLTIKGEKSEKRESDETGTHVSERRYGSFTRSFPVPANVDRDRITAKMADGVLTLELPKAAGSPSGETPIAVTAA